MQYLNPEIERIEFDSISVKNSNGLAIVEVISNGQVVYSISVKDDLFIAVRATGVLDTSAQSITTGVL